MNDKLKDTKLMVIGLLNREQMLHGFRENNLMTPEIEELDDDALAEEVAKNIIRMNPLL